MLRMTPRRTLLAAIATIAALTLPAVVPHAAAQRPQRPRTGFAFYDVDRLYDTLPSPFYDDADFTPQGRLKWDTERYRSKIRRTAAVIDSMALPLVALYGVENERVVRDLAAACRGDYSYLHRTLNTLDGLDFALLYYGDRFFPHRTEPGDRTLYVEGTLGRDTVGLLLVRDRRMLPWIIGELHEERPQVRLLVAGSVTPRDAARWGLHDATARAEEAGRGTVRSGGRWVMRDRILADPRLVACRSFDGRPAPNHRPAALSGRIRSLAARIRIHTVDFFGGFEKFCYIRNPFTGNRLTCGRRNDAATLLPSPVETFFCNFLI